jgi:hypothetical protein
VGKGKHEAKAERETKAMARWKDAPSFSARLGVYAEIMGEALLDETDDEWEQLFGRGIVSIFETAQKEFLSAEMAFGRPIDFSMDAGVILANVSHTAKAVWRLACDSMRSTDPEEKP